MDGERSFKPTSIASRMILVHSSTTTICPQQLNSIPTTGNNLPTSPSHPPRNVGSTKTAAAPLEGRMQLPLPLPKGCGLGYSYLMGGIWEHPLLSLGWNSPTQSEQGSIGATGSGSSATLIINGSPKYVPYTPRQCITTTAATTGMTVHPPSLQQHQGYATSKLQLMHLKVAVQGLSVDSGTLGWSILEKLVMDIEISEEWTEVWNVITTGKVCYNFCQVLYQLKFCEYRQCCCCP